MLDDTVEHSAAIWQWQGDGPASWYFITFDGDAGEAIAAHEAQRRLELGSRRRGFGSVKVEARIRETSWRTSVFPGKAQGGYLLPVKAAVRKAEGIGEGDVVSVRLTLL